MSRQVDFPAGERAECEVTVLIKAYNEEAKIKDCLDSVMSSIHGLSAEVVLIDSLSIDRTVEIAMPYPISIVQFVRREDCGAAAAVELGYRVSRGRYIYVLDGDMELEPGFLLHALDWLKRNPSYAGVAGILSDTTVRNFEDRRRQASRDSQGGRNHDHLGSGGLYRREVIRQLGYLAHFGLKAYEEAELGFRIVTAGWHLHRLSRPGVRHTGHDEGSFSVILRQWRTGRTTAAGLFLRSAIGKPHFKMVLSKFKHPFGIAAMWISLCIALILGLSGMVYGIVLCSFLMSLALVFKKGSVSDTLLSLALWHIAILGIVRGFFMRIAPPESEIQYRFLRQAECATLDRPE